MESPLLSLAVVMAGNKFVPPVASAINASFPALIPRHVAGKWTMTGNIGKLVKCVCYNE